MSDTGAEMSQQ